MKKFVTVLLSMMLILTLAPAALAVQYSVKWDGVPDRGYGYDVFVDGVYMTSGGWGPSGQFTYDWAPGQHTLTCEDHVTGDVIFTMTFTVPGDGTTTEPPTQEPATTTPAPATTTPAPATTTPAPATTTPAPATTTPAPATTTPAPATTTPAPATTTPAPATTTPAPATTTPAPATTTPAPATTTPAPQVTPTSSSLPQKVTPTPEPTKTAVAGGTSDVPKTGDGGAAMMVGLSCAMVLAAACLICTRKYSHKRK